MKLNKAIGILIGASMISASSAPVSIARSVPVRPDIRPHHPVNCSIFDGMRGNRGFPRGRGVVGKVRSQPNQNSLPPPPPASAPSPSQQIVVTGTRAAEAGVLPRRPYPYPVPQPQDRERYEGEDVANIKRVASEPVSTFSVDVDTGAYANVRRFLNEGRTPPAAAVRTEEMINYFRYDYPRPTDRSRPFSITTNVAQTPWNKNSKLLRIGLRGYDVARNERPAANLVFLVDVSGSMGSQKKLPLVKSTLNMLADQLGRRDKVSIVVYSGTVGLLLRPTSNKAHIKQAVDCLFARGSTAGGHALKLAYSTARANFKKGGINRIILATDGDFNVGTTSTDDLKNIVKRERESGVTLTALGFGTGNYREELMEGIANVGNGNYAYIDSAMEGRKVLSEELTSTLFTIAKDVKVQVEFNPDKVKEYRLIGYENRLLAEEDFDNDKVDAGDIGAGHQVTALYEIVPTGVNGWLPQRRYSANQKKAERPAGPSTEFGFVKIRYKLPQGKRSMLIEKPLSSGLLAQTRMPRGDMAFVTAVAAFGQKLRGDKYLGDFDYSDISRMAGSSSNYWRQEFVKLTELANSQSGS